MDCSPPGFSVHVISQQEYWSELPHPLPGDLPDPGIEPTSPAFQADSSPAEPSEKAKYQIVLTERKWSGCSLAPDLIHLTYTWNLFFLKAKHLGPSWDLLRAERFRSGGVEESQQLSTSKLLIAALCPLLHLRKLFLSRRLLKFRSWNPLSAEEKTEAALRHYKYYPSYVQHQKLQTNKKTKSSREERAHRRIHVFPLKRRWVFTDPLQEPQGNNTSPERDARLWGPLTQQEAQLLSSSPSPPNTHVASRTALEQPKHVYFTSMHATAHATCAY